MGGVGDRGRGDVAQKLGLIENGASVCDGPWRLPRMYGGEDQHRQHCLLASPLCLWRTAPSTPSAVFVACIPAVVA